MAVGIQSSTNSVRSGRKRDRNGSDAIGISGAVILGLLSLRLDAAQVAKSANLSNCKSLLELSKLTLSDFDTHAQLSNGIGILSATFKCLLLCILKFDEINGPSHESEECFLLASRILGALAGSRELSKHAYLFVGTTLDTLSQFTPSTAVRQLLLPGLFVLLDSCSPRQHKAVSSILNMKAKLCLARLTEWYHDDFKFKGNS